MKKILVVLLLLGFSTSVFAGGDTPKDPIDRVQESGLIIE